MLYTVFFYRYQYGSVDFKRLSKNIIIKDKPVLGDWLVGLLIIVYRFSRECPTNIEPVQDCFRVGSALLTIELWEFLDMTHLLWLGTFVYLVLQLSPPVLTIKSGTVGSRTPIFCIRGDALSTAPRVAAVRQWSAWHESDHFLPGGGGVTTLSFPFRTLSSLFSMTRIVFWMACSSVASITPPFCFLYDVIQWSSAFI